jgi:pyruvate,water dikinase
MQQQGTAGQSDDSLPISFPLTDVRTEHAPLVGNKASRLAHLSANGLPVPDGFILSAAAYHQLVRGAGLHERLCSELQSLDISDLERISLVSKSLREQVLTAPLPPRIEVAIRAELRRMMSNARETFAARTSAVTQDGALSFAGQFDTRIHVPQDELAAAYREVCSSHYNMRAIAYRMNSRLAESGCSMAVVFLRMIRARTSGVLYTRDPAHPRADRVLATASWGVGFTGASRGDRFLVSRGRHHAVLACHPAFKSVRNVLLPEGGMCGEAVPSHVAAMPSVSNEELAALADLALRVERVCGRPQNIEWAIDERGAIWILQASDLRVNAQSTRSRRPPKVPPLLTGGIPVCPGQVSAPVHTANSGRDLTQVPDGAILVLRHVCPECVKFLPRISGLIVDFGNPEGHAATLIREYEVPALFEADEASRLLAQVDTVSLDATERRVYPGALFIAQAGERVMHVRREGSKNATPGRR